MKHSLLSSLAAALLLFSTVSAQAALPVCRISVDNNEFYKSVCVEYEDGDTIADIDISYFDGVNFLIQYSYHRTAPDGTMYICYIDVDVSTDGCKINSTKGRLIPVPPEPESREIF